MAPEINYKRLVGAMEYYEAKGFTEVIVPWTVENKYTDITKPSSLENFKLNNLCLVGSAEQSLIKLRDTNKIKDNIYYMALSPCFRDDKEDLTHFKYFMKLELCVFGVNRIEKLIAVAESFFNKYVNVNRKITKEGADLEVQGVEIGSYGFRKYNNICWTYGTGIAEPRFTQVIKLKRR